MSLTCFPAEGGVGVDVMCILLARVGLVCDLHAPRAARRAVRVSEVGAKTAVLISHSTPPCIPAPVLAEQAWMALYKRAHRRACALRVSSHACALTPPFRPTSPPLNPTTPPRQAQRAPFTILCLVSSRASCSLRSPRRTARSQGLACWPAPKSGSCKAQGIGVDDLVARAVAHWPNPPRWHVNGYLSKLVAF